MDLISKISLLLVSALLSTLLTRVRPRDLILPIPGPMKIVEDGEEIDMSVFNDLN